ncbi:MAG: ABC transporter substrate-binding protein [Erythrobacter sp.]|jgi:iron complex transport system substrate-binding protein|nr:ABC transporter substrate-binding protein [Erythrobacter sp.]
MQRILALLLAFLVASCAAEQEQEPIGRIVTIGGDMTEIVFALGAGDRIVAADDRSFYPEQVNAIPKVGYLRRLSAEGVLATDPDLVLISGAAGPEAALEQIRGVGIEIVEMPEVYSLEGLMEKVRRVAEAIGKVEAGEELVAKIEAEWQSAQAEIARFDAPPRALFFTMLREGVPQAAGTDTAAHGVIELLGGTNLFASQSGYTPISTEAAVAADPDIILVMTHDAGQNGGLDGIVASPAIGLTEAVQAGRVFLVDSVQIMQFGPRLPKAMAELAKAINEGRQAFEIPSDASPDSTS